MGATTSARGAWIATLALLIAALAANYVSLAPMVDSSHGDWDAIHLYFPLAQGLLDQGWRFFADPRSVQAPPLSYAYPALLGVSMHALKVANAILSGVTLLAVFRSAWLMHSRAAGVVGAFLFALSPTLRPHLATPVTEGPFILLCALWFWGAAEWIVKGRRAALAASAVAIGLAALTRATMFYAIVLLAGAAAVAAWRSRGDTRRRALEALAAYGVILLPILAFIAKNWLLFGFPFYTTGGANALYLGNNPLTGGYDPNYLDLYFDVGAIAQDQSHLTLEAERLLGGAARMIFAEKDAAFLAHLHLQKLAAFIFVTSAETDAYVQRLWRIALVVLSAGAIPRRRGDVLAWLLFATLAYQVAVHVPVLYTHRYSVDALDLWLVIAAGIGVTRWGLAPKPWIPVSAIAATGLAVAAGAYLFRTAPAPSPDVFAVARWRVWQAPIPGGEELTHRRGRLDVPFGNAPWLSPANNHVVVVDAASRVAGEAACGPLRASFQPAGGTRFSRAIELRIPADGAPHRLQHGAIPLGLAPEGTLRLEAQCPEGAALRLGAVAVYAALGAIDYRSRFLGERLPMPVER